jgi:hypothetical protein
MIVIIIIIAVIIIIGHHHHCNCYCSNVAEISVGSVGKVTASTLDDRRLIPDRDSNLFLLCKTQTSLRKTDLLFNLYGDYL